MKKVTATCGLGSDKKQQDSSWDNHLLLHSNNNNISSSSSSFDEKDNNNPYNSMYGCGGITWPPRNYTCTFCRRKFKSAQALGGHMNVHRRDRALLRTQPPSWLLHFPPIPNPNPNPNIPIPNPEFVNYSSSSAATLIPPLNSWMSTSPSEKAVMVMGPPSTTSRPFSRVGLEAFSTQEGGFNKVMSNGKIARLDLEIESSARNKKEDLDLELRLGF